MSYNVSKYVEAVPSEAITLSIEVRGDARIVTDRFLAAIVLAKPLVDAFSRSARH